MRKLQNDLDRREKEWKLSKERNKQEENEQNRE